jgi:hypothetical protein
VGTEACPLCMMAFDYVVMPLESTIASSDDPEAIQRTEARQKLSKRKIRYATI